MANTKTPSVNGSASAPAKSEREVGLPPIKRKLVTLTIKTSGPPVVMHKWSEKAKDLMRDKHAGKKTKNRDVRNPSAECEESAYKTEDGRYGLNVLAIKSAILGAAHKDLGIEKTLVRKALFVVCTDRNFVVPFDGKQKYEMHEDTVRVGVGSADLRYRPYFHGWSATVTFEIDEALLQVPDLLTLIEWAGSRVGIGEMRPEKGGEFGRFRIDMDRPITEQAA